MSASRNKIKSDMSRKVSDFFWLSYSDLMTSLFFVMLVLFVLVFSTLKNEQNRLKLKLEEYEKIEEIKLAINNIDTSYFKYDRVYKKHILNIQTHFNTQSYDINNIPLPTRIALVKAGNLILNLIKSLPKEENINYLIIVEGQASRDNWSGNDLLSYNRALSLKQLWIDNGIDFSELKNCELVIAGSGQGGMPRIRPDMPPNNQRFLIHITPKVGQIEYHNEK
jgi:hypothetical protein